MKCPYCGENMEPGHILSGRGAFFWPDAKGDAPILWMGKRGIRKAGGIPLWEDGLAMFYFDRPAWACRACNKLVADLDLQK